MVEFRRITEENFEECVALRVHDRQQNFVATNLISMAQAYLSLSNSYCIPMPFAIYDGDMMVGFIMMSYHDRPKTLSEQEPYDEAIYSVWRLMIDMSYQRKGYGKQAVQRAVEFLREKPCGEASKVVICYEPDNEIARKLYASCGFVETDNRIDGEVVALFEM